MNSNNPFEDPEIAADYESWYHTTGIRAAEEEKSLIKNFIQRYSNVGRILEVGCGTGYFTSWFEKLGLKAVGLDSSRYMIQEAHENHRLFCVQGDGLALPFDEKSFDIVALITTLEFLENPEQVLRETLRVAHRGLILGVINKYSLLGLRYKRKGRPIWGQARLFSLNETVSMLKEILSGNNNITIRTTLWPVFSGSSKLPWGGFIGVNVRLLSEVER